MLPDLLAPDLKAVFCGTAAGTASAAAGAYYAGPGNKFWPTLSQIGLTPRQLAPTEYPLLLTYGLGLTDVCKVAAGSDREIGRHRWDLPGLSAKLQRHRPEWLAFNGKAAAKAVLERPVDYGAQDESLGGVRLFVLPSTSSAASGHWSIEPWQEFSMLVGPDR